MQHVSAYTVCKCKTSSFSGAGDVWFSLKDKTYQNNSKVILEHIGEHDDDALLCMTNQTACCQHHMNGMRHDMGNWFFPNGTRVHNENSSGEEWDVYGSRGQMVVRLHRRRGGEEGIYSCKIPDTLGFIQTIYIGVYSGEWYMYTSVLFNYCRTASTVDNEYG